MFNKILPKTLKFPYRLFIIKQMFTALRVYTQILVHIADRIPTNIIYLYIFWKICIGEIIKVFLWRPPTILCCTRHYFYYWNKNFNNEKLKPCVLQTLYRRFESGEISYCNEEEAQTHMLLFIWMICNLWSLDTGCMG